MKLTTTLAALLLATTGLGLGGCAADTEASSAESTDAVVHKPTEAEKTVSGSARAEARIELFQGIDGQYYFHLVAANGQIVLQSEGYESQDGAKNGIASVLDNGLNAESYEFRDAVNGESYFVLKAENNKVIGRSETYVSKSNAERGAATTKSLVRELNGKEPISPKFQRLFEIFKSDADEKFYFHLRAKNGEIVLQSQGYSSKQSAEKGIKSVINNGDTRDQFEVLEASSGEWYFRLKSAGNNKVIGRSETYASKANAERGVEAVLNLIRANEF